MPVVRFHTSLGDIDVALRPDVAPINVANFLSYVNSGAYNSTSFIHRSVKGFILQGGGYYYSNGQINAITQQSPVINEFKLSNVRGTLVMAKLINDPNSATSQWFFNTADNSSTLDTQSGGYTVIGTITNAQGLAVMDAIASLQTANIGMPFDSLPVVNYGGGSIAAGNLVYSGIANISTYASFFNGEKSLSNGVFSLALSSGAPFGYYAHLDDPNYIYHFDLGYEYLIDTNDGNNGIYLYDFGSSTYFYTNPALFPYLYDFNLKSFLYYFQGTKNPRVFYNFGTAQFINK